MKKYCYILMALLYSGCIDSLTPDNVNSGVGKQICFSIDGSIGFSSNLTKTVEADISNLDDGFNVSCVKGTPGSDVSVWNSTKFTKNGSSFSGGRIWPDSDESYRFFAVWPSSYAITFSASGSTISASSSDDVVVAYCSSSSFGEENLLTFNHIFSRIGNVSVSALDGYTLSNVCATIVPVVSGTYNIYSGAWSNKISGQERTIVSSVGAAQVNNIYLVPGDYKIFVTWTASRSSYTETFTDVPVRVSLVSGNKNNISLNLGGNLNSVFVGVSLMDWEDTDYNSEYVSTDPADYYSLPGEFTVNEDGKKVRFSKGNLWAHISSGPTNNYNYTADEWGFYDNQLNYSGRTLSVGNKVDLFRWVGESASYYSYGLCSCSEVENVYYGTDAGENLKSDWGDIPGVISACGSGWYTLSTEEWIYLLSSRTGCSTVGNVSDAKYVTATVNSIKGLILFPDNYLGGTPSGVSWSGINSTTGTFSTSVNAAGWKVLESFGCVFLPCAGCLDGSSALNRGEFGYYWSRTSKSSTGSYHIRFSNSKFYTQEGNRRKFGFSVRLVKNIK